MKAICYNQFGTPEVLQLQEVDRPVAEAGQVLVKVNAAGVNPVDYKIRNGSMKFIAGRKFPRIPGGDLAGVVEEAGDGRFRKGDRVFGMLDYKGGAYAEYVAVQEDQLALIPDGTDMVTAAATPLASLTALQAFRKRNGIKAGDKVLVNGASGGVGSFAVQIAKALGTEVTAVCSTKNLSLVKDLGADEVIDYTRQDFTKLGETFHTVFDAVGKSGFRACKPIIAEGGKYVSTIPNNGLFFHQAFNFLRDKTAHFIITKPSGTELSEVADMLKDGRVKPFIEATFTLEEAPEAHRRIETERVKGKLVLTL